MLREGRVTAKGIAEKFVSGVLKKMAADPRPPCAGGSKQKWNLNARCVLQDMGTTFGYATQLEWCTLDLMWWDKSPERMVLAVESEMADSPDLVETDFEKLPSFKCRFKLLAFSADVGRVRGNAEGYLQLFGQHVKDEEYILIGFTPSGPRCFHFTAPRGGKLEKVRFDELQLSKAVLRAA